MRTGNLCLLIFLLCCSFLGSGRLHAQQPVHFVIGAQELANVEVYSLLQSEDEILYAATDHGLYAYKHGAFEQIPGPDAQHGTSLFSLQKDRKGNLYCCNLSGQVFVLNGDKLALYYETSLSKVASQFSFGFDVFNQLHIGSKMLAGVDVANSELSILDDKSEGPGTYTLFESPNENLYAITPASKLLQISDQTHRIEEWLPLVDPSSVKSPITSLFFSENGAVYGLLTNGELIGEGRKNLPKQAYPLKSRERYFQFEFDEIYGLNYSKGARALQLEGNQMVQKEVFFQDKFLSTMTVGQQGNLYFGTFGEGILVVPNRNAERVNTEKAKGHLRGVALGKEGEVFLSTRAGEVFRYKDELELIFAKQGDPLGRIYHFDGRDFGLSKDYPGLVYDASSFMSTIKNARLQSDASILIATAHGVLRHSEGRGNSPLWTEIDPFMERLNLYEERCYAAAYDSKGASLYVATANQLHLVTKDGGITELEFKGQSIGCNDLLANGNQVIAATQKYGLLFIENGEVVKPIDHHNGLASDFVRKMIQVDGLLYVAHQQGVQSIDLKTNAMERFGISEGVPAGTVMDFAVSRDHLWMLVDDALISIGLENRLRKVPELNLRIDSIVVAGYGALPKEEHSFTQQTSFDYDQNRITFHIDFRMIELVGEAKMQYQLENYDDEWQEVAATQAAISYKSLPVGEYVFRIKVAWRNIESKTFSFSFKVMPPFWQRWWFFLLCAVVLFAIVGFIFNYRIRQIRKVNEEKLHRQEMEKNLVESKLKALRSQMNPHFIFNSLNSIQDLILRQDTDQAYDYVVLFADLVRSTLRYSEKEYIKIEEELEFLNTYLTLEELRFKEAFSYEFSYEDSKDVEIPSMVIQPFIENALQHGLLHKAGQKQLDINFKLADVLICTITDNGIGRAASAEIQNRQGGRHDSFSLDAIQKRMEILAEKDGTEIGYEIEDLIEDGEAKGTRVTIRLSYKRRF